jgi:hypothetical protein
MIVRRLPTLALALALLASALAPPPDASSADEPLRSEAARAAGVLHHAGSQDPAAHPCPGHAGRPGSAEAPLAVWKARCPCGCGDAAAPVPGHGRLVGLLGARIALRPVTASVPAPTRPAPIPPATPLAPVDHVPRPA